ncbi:MAG TPA: hypothetical protein VJR02_19730 [Pyrinomonadaceae bacterium]|nr:hypothetical protein [Pyrinomonadaceae bacterium]
MNRPNDHERAVLREKAIYRYVEALDRAELEIVAEVIALAIDDPELSQAIIEINSAFQQEMQLTPLSADAEIVRTLIHEHLGSGELAHTENLPLTVGEVAAKLKSDRRVPFTEERVNDLLLNNQQPLPALLSFEATKQIGRDLGIEASDRFWRAFRDAAITLSMGRGRESQLLAARIQREGRKSIGTQRKTHFTGKTDDEQ